MENGLNDRFAYVCTKQVQLRGIIPRHVGPVIPMIDVRRLSCPVVDSLKDNRGIFFRPIAVFNTELNVLVLRQVSP